MLERVNMFLEKLVSEHSVVTRELAAIIYRGLSSISNEYFEISPAISERKFMLFESNSAYKVC